MAKKIDLKELDSKIQSMKKTAEELKDGRGLPAFIGTAAVFWPASDLI
jgi:hypothetical protein